MESWNTPSLVDEHGTPFDERLQLALRRARSQFRREFTDLTDDVVVTEVLEEAGRRIREHERLEGDVQDLPAYTWVTVQNIGRSRRRRPTMRVIRRSLDADDSGVALGQLAATEGSPCRLESAVLVREVFNRLSDADRELLEFKKLGFSGRQIAARTGKTVTNVNITFFRLRRKLRRLLDGNVQEPRSVNTAATKVPTT